MQDMSRKMRIRLTAIVLALVALGFYVGFILLSASRSS